MNKIEILQGIAEKLRNKYGKEPGIFHELESIVLENAAEPNSPIMTEDIISIIKEVASKHGLLENSIGFTTNKGNIHIFFSKD